MSELEQADSAEDAQGSIQGLRAENKTLRIEAHRLRAALKRVGVLVCSRCGAIDGEVRYDSHGEGRVVGVHGDPPVCWWCR